MEGGVSMQHTECFRWVHRKCVGAWGGRCGVSVSFVCWRCLEWVGGLTGGTEWMVHAGWR